MRPEHVYVHVPFCARRCAYCDFAIAVRPRIPAREYIAALQRELEIRYPAGEHWSVSTLYLGGGTPSLLGGEGVARVLDGVLEHASLQPGAEVTLEANPDDVTPEAARSWKTAGVTRLSLGGQSFDDRVLAWMRRTHTSAQIRRAVAVARRAGIELLSLDLIFAVPGALERDWRHDLDRALELETPHLSLYGLTVEPHTPLARWRERGTAVEAPEERFEEEFLLAHEILSAAGYGHYEVSNYARPGCESRHNSGYWLGRPYTGLGPAAHEFDGQTRRWNIAAYAEWQRRLALGTDPVAEEERLTDANRYMERVYLGLRTSVGLPVVDAEVTLALPWIRAGWATVSAGHLALTPTGWLRLDSIAGVLTGDTSHY